MMGSTLSTSPDKKSIDNSNNNGELRLKLFLNEEKKNCSIIITNLEVD